MIKISVIRQAHCPIGTPYIVRTVQTAATIEKRIRGELHIFVIGERRMRRLNAQYRNVDRSTDVLSFAWQETPGSSEQLGELFLSYAYIKRQASRFNVSAREEFTRMLVHGLLHMCGYDHVRTKDATRMFAVQEKAVSLITGR